MFGLGIHELEAVGEDVELYFQGYKFYFAVDAYDLVHFFFPYLDTLQFTEANVSQLAREAIAYDAFFSNIGTGPILLLEEYKDELAIVRDLFLKRMKRATELTQNIEQLTAEIVQLKDSGKELGEIAYTNPELCFLLLVFMQRQGEMKELSFMKFLRKKVYISSFATEDEEFNIYADEAFSQPYDRSFVANIFGQFRQRVEVKHKTMSYDELDRYYYNTFKDIVAIEKVLTANKTIANHEKYKKTVFYYLSSTPVKTRILFELINNAYMGEMPHSVHFKSGRSIHRNILQLFLFTILVNEYRESKEMPIKILTLIKNYRLKEQGYEASGLNENEREVVEALNKLLSKVSSNIENHLLSSIFNNYKNTLDDIARVGNEQVASLIKDVLKKFEHIQVEQNNIQEGEAYLKYNISKHGQLSLLKQAVTNEKGPKIMVTIRPGKDIVRLNYHHLPFLVFIYNREAWEKHASFYRAMNEISEIVSANKSFKLSVIGFLKDFFLWWHSNEVEQRTQELLMSIYIDLLSISVSGDVGDPDLELDLIAILEVRVDSLIKLFDEDNNREMLRIELYYVLIWLYRRCNKFDELVKLEIELTATGTWDMRIWHGLGLAYEALFYHKGKQPEDVWMLEKSKKYLEQAGEGYNDFLGKISNKYRDVRVLVTKSIIGIGNSNCDTFLRLYDVDGNADHIMNARSILSEIKDHTETLAVDYDNIPIINHTEADLEYYEAFLLYQKKEFNLAKKKILYAEKRFYSAVNKESHMSEDSKGVGDKIAELKQKIINRV